MAEGQRSGVSRALSWLLSLAVIGGLATLVLYLASEINSRKYRLAAHEGSLVIEKGRMMPAGFEPYVPRAQSLAQAYEPIPLPEGETFPQSEEFDDRADLDRALFAVLAGWSRKALESEDLEALAKATTYIERSELLPGLSEQQRIDLKSLRADLAYRRARRMIDQAGELLVQALAELKSAQKLGTSRPNDAEAWIKEVERRIAGGAGPKALPAERPPEENPAPTAAPGAPEVQGGSAVDGGNAQRQWRL